MKKLISIAAGLLLTSSAFANTVTLYKSANLSTADYATKSEALNAGFDIIDNLSTLTKSELRKELPAITTNGVHNLAVKNTEVQTTEFSLDRNNTQYRAIVKVNYSFDTQDND